MPKFYGQFEIAHETASEDENSVVLTFAPYKKDEVEVTPPELEVSMVNYSNVVSDEPVDWATHREKRLDPVISKVLSVLLEHNIFIGRGEGVSSDLQYVLDNVIYSLGKWRNAVEDHLWGQPEHLKTMKQLDEYFKKSLQ